MSNNTDILLEKVSESFEPRTKLSFFLKMGLIVNMIYKSETDISSMDLKTI